MSTSPSLPRLAAALVAGLALGAGAMLLVRPRGSAPAATAPTSKPRWTCPMHPAYVSDRPGECPSCGMALVPLEPQARRPLFYRSPMDPKITSPVPMKDSMGMDFVPVYDEGEPASGVPGLGTVQLDARRQQLIGLRTAKAVLASLGGEWRAPGRVVADETRVRKVSVRVEGYVEGLRADFVGKPVAAGQPLFELQSPELLGAQKEYLLALRFQGQAGASPELQARSREWVESARRRLRLWEVPEASLRRLEAGGEPLRALPVLAPASGVVSAKAIAEGSRVAPGDPVLEITDLSRVWVVAEVQESDLGRVRVGQGASFSLQGEPGAPLPAKVAFIDPVMDPRTRTAKVRLNLENPRGRLKPDLFGEVVFREAERRTLSVPRDAVLEAGTEMVVFVALGEGRFEPRSVRTGAQGPDRVEILGGLTEGEEVVVKAAFLVDSESRLKAALAAMARGR